MILLTFQALMGWYLKLTGVIQVTDSASTFIAIVLGLGVFLTIVAIGWRSVQHRRILRMQGADGQETIIVAREDDEITSVVTTGETGQAAPSPSGPVAKTGAVDRAPDA
jgi:hypothetical protein